MKAILSRNAGKELIAYLEEKGYGIELFGPMESAAEPVSCHPDMFMCSLRDEMLYRGDENLVGKSYPEDIRYNACSTGKYFIHNLKYTDPKLIKMAEELGLVFVNVPQGYAKCSIVAVDENSIITYDEGIADACEKAGLEVLKVRQGYVSLPGYDTGFIGGCSGRLPGEIVFNGNLGKHPDCEAIQDFIRQRGLECRYFGDFELTDIGTVIITNGGE